MATRDLFGLREPGLGALVFRTGAHLGRAHLWASRSECFEIISRSWCLSLARELFPVLTSHDLERGRTPPWALDHAEVQARGSCTLPFLFTTLNLCFLKVI